MRILPEPIAFLWDQGNLDENLKKHKVSLQEAEEVFVNEPLTIAEDHKHSSDKEIRLYALGRTKAGRKLFTAFTIRDKKIRIISIRDMSKKERIQYGKLESNS
ncbi:MAG TPA: BrnT family toxin [Candidatus Saccharimonadales bacterium]|nr:BrnT family toxin [Candidatus Saccharimonadales bacterium]